MDWPSATPPGPDEFVLDPTRVTLYIAATGIER